MSEKILQPVIQPFPIVNDKVATEWIHGLWSPEAPDGFISELNQVVHHRRLGAYVSVHFVWPVTYPETDQWIWKNRSA